MVDNICTIGVLEIPHVVRRIFIIGSSGVGKTSLVNSVRQQGFYVPKRYITRAGRLNDDIVENEHVTHKKFQELIDKNVIDIHWQRDLGRQEKERYGFARTDNDRITIYSANMALVANDSALIPQDILKEGLFIGISLPQELRSERFKKRSPDLGEQELRLRLQDDPENVRKYAHFVIDNRLSFSDVAPVFLKTITDFSVDDAATQQLNGLR